MSVRTYYVIKSGNRYFHHISREDCEQWAGKRGRYVFGSKASAAEQVSELRSRKGERKHYPNPSIYRVTRYTGLALGLRRAVRVMSQRTLNAARAAEQKVDRMIEKLGEQAPLKELQGRLF